MPQSLTTFSHESQAEGPGLRRRTAFRCGALSANFQCRTFPFQPQSSESSEDGSPSPEPSFERRDAQKRSGCCGWIAGFRRGGQLEPQKARDFRLGRAAPDVQAMSRGAGQAGRSGAPECRRGRQLPKVSGDRLTIPGASASA